MICDAPSVQLRTSLGMPAGCGHEEGATEQERWRAGKEVRRGRGRGREEERQGPGSRTGLGACEQWRAGKEVRRGRRERGREEEGGREGGNDHFGWKSLRADMSSTRATFLPVGRRRREEGY
eukprot:755529-Hanusia_phi.AAC.2